MMQTFAYGVPDGPSVPAFHASMVENVVYAVCLAMLVLNIPLCVLDGQLIVLHSFLSYKGLTTFEYIIFKATMPEEPEKPSVMERLKECFKGGRCELPNCLDWFLFIRKKPKKKKVEEAPEKANGDAFDSPPQPQTAKTGAVAVAPAPAAVSPRPP